MQKDHTADVLFPGKKIAGSYSLQARLGRTALADVWLAEKDKQSWVVKLYTLPEQISPEHWEQMQTAMNQLPQFPTPLLQRPVDSGMIDGLPYVILPYCQYGSAKQWAGKLSESELATFMYQGAKALKMLHEAEPPILHGNIHLGNFLIDKELNYVLADVVISGMLRKFSSSADTEYLDQAFQAPETFDPGRYGPESDIFSLGACMYYMATGKTAFGPKGGQRLLHWVQTPKLPEYFSYRFNQIVLVCIGRVASGRPSADILVRLAERYLAEGEWKSIPGFSFGVGRSSKKKRSFFQRLLPVPRDKQRANPYSWSKSVGSINYKWLIPASIALGIGITLYFINPLLDLGPQSSTRVETPEQNQGPIFAPGPDESMAVLSAKDTNTVSSDTIASAESVEPAEDSKELLAEAPQPSDAKKEPETAVISQPSEPDPTPIATIDRKSESPVDEAPIIATPTETPKPSEGPKAVRMRSQELRDLRKVINSANALESELSD
ncbi:MAG: protein kinase, partial [Bacteroidota bacterium]